jgi:chromosome segregation ATPase
MPDNPDLHFIGRQIERLISEVSTLRDEVRVVSATMLRLDNTRERHEALLNDMLAEIRAIHQQTSRMNDRIRRLENGAA